ncbi:MAG TPA: hypothetical protein VFA66_11575 [Gaiellaceae bacterium]|nr:hypothetical protein [Gaiellaceae bacterium]
MIADEAAIESPLWAEALLPVDERRPVAVFSPLCPTRFALGLETIYEGYLLHYGRPRLFTPRDRHTTLLLGDYLYAHGLVRVAETRDVDAVADLAALISRCAQLRAEQAAGDGEAWVATAALLGRSPLASSTDPLDLKTLAAGAAGAEPVERALALHRSHAG